MDLNYPESTLDHKNKDLVVDEDAWLGIVSQLSWLPTHKMFGSAVCSVGVWICRAQGCENSKGHVKTVASAKHISQHRASASDIFNT